MSPPTRAVAGCRLLRLRGPRRGGGPGRGAKACGGAQGGALVVAGAGEIDDRPAGVLRRHGRAGASREGRRVHALPGGVGVDARGAVAGVSCGSTGTNRTPGPPRSDPAAAQEVSHRMAAFAPAQPPGSGDPDSAAPLGSAITALPGASGAGSAWRVQWNTCATSVSQLR